MPPRTHHACMMFNVSNVAPTSRSRWESPRFRPSSSRHDRPTPSTGIACCDCSGGPTATDLIVPLTLWSSYPTPPLTTTAPARAPPPSPLLRSTTTVQELAVVVTVLTGTRWSNLVRRPRPPGPRIWNSTVGTGHTRKHAGWEKPDRSETTRYVDMFFDAPLTYCYCIKFRAAAVEGHRPTWRLSWSTALKWF